MMLIQEKMMPGVVMASGGQVFDMLYQLSGLDEPRLEIMFWIFVVIT